MNESNPTTNNEDLNQIVDPTNIETKKFEVSSDVLTMRRLDEDILSTEKAWSRVDENDGTVRMDKPDRDLITQFKKELQQGDYTFLLAKQLAESDYRRLEGKGVTHVTRESGQVAIADLKKDHNELAMFLGGKMFPESMDVSPQDLNLCFYEISKDYFERVRFHMPDTEPESVKERNDNFKISEQFSTFSRYSGLMVKSDAILSRIVLSSSI